MAPMTAARHQRVYRAGCWSSCALRCSSCWTSETKVCACDTVINSDMPKQQAAANVLMSLQQVAPLVGVDFRQLAPGMAPNRLCRACGQRSQLDRAILVQFSIQLLMDVQSPDGGHASRRLTFDQCTPSKGTSHNSGALNDDRELAMLLQQQELALYSVQTSEQQLSDAELAMRLQAEEELYAGEALPWFDATNAWPQVGVV